MKGALFCDGQYIDHGGNLDRCVSALEAALDLEVMAEASGEASCGDGDGCHAEGRASASVSSCSVRAPGRDGAPRSMLFAGLWVLAGLIGLRRRLR
jgi:hypothetical protein